MSKSPEQLAKDIIKNNQYIVLATVGNGPWASPVYYCVDDLYNFYFISHADSKHILNILRNPSVSFAIFDSHQPVGEGVGVQGIGAVKQLTDEEISEGLKWYHVGFMELTKEKFEQSGFYRFFKLETTELYVPDPDDDKRVSVDLQLLRKV